MQRLPIVPNDTTARTSPEFFEVRKAISKIELYENTWVSVEEAIQTVDEFATAWSAYRAKFPDAR